MQRMAIIAAAAGALVVTATVPASAGNGVVFENRGTFSYNGHDDYRSEACGFDVWFQAEGREIFRAFDDGSIKHHNSVDTTYVSETGSLTLQQVVNVEIAEASTFDETTGHLTIDVKGDIRGVFGKWRSADGRIVRKEVGNIHFEVHEVIDTNNDEAVSSSFTEDLRGQWPEDTESFVCEQLA